MATMKRITVPITRKMALAVLSAINSSPPITVPNMTAPRGVWEHRLATSAVRIMKNTE